MNIFQLRCFLAVAEHLNFAKAAQEMQVSQPAITHQIKTLEEELQVKLFYRSTRIVELTLEGQAFVSDAKSMVSIADRAKMRFSNPQERPISFLSVGSSSYHHLACLADSLHELSSEIDNLHPRLQVAQREQLFRMLDSDILDAIFEIGDEKPPKGDILYKGLYASSIVCACRADAPLVQQEVVTAERLRTEKIILCDPLSLSPKIVEMQLKLAEGRDPTDIHFSSSVDASIVMALAGLGTAILPDILIPPGDELTKIPISDAPTVPLGMFYKAHPGDHIVKQFLQIVKKNFKKLKEDSETDG
jgi:DNA-binding transcriptional LysR family regulator